MPTAATFSGTARAVALAVGIRVTRLFLTGRLWWQSLDESAWSGSAGVSRSVVVPACTARMTDMAERVVPDDQMIAEVTAALLEFEPAAEIVPGPHGIKRMSEDVAEVLWTVPGDPPRLGLAWICRSSKKVSLVSGWPL